MRSIIRRVFVLGILSLLSIEDAAAPLLRLRGRRRRWPRRSFGGGRERRVGLRVRRVAEGRHGRGGRERRRHQRRHP